MIELLESISDNTVAFSATGKVTGDDYENVLIPAIEAKLKTHDKIRLLYHVGDGFSGYDGGAMWDDAKVGMKHLTHFEKVAVVSDTQWLITATKTFGFMIPCEVKTFSNAELDKAKTWIAR